MTSGQRGAAWILAVFCAGLPACTTVETSRSSDYVGPAGQSDDKAQGASPSPGPESPALSESARPAGPLHLNVSHSVLLALENNRSLAVDRYNVPIRRTAEAQQRAAFDPDVTGQFLYTRTRTAEPGTTSGLLPYSESYSGQLGIMEFLPTGTTFSLTGSETQSRFFPPIPGAKFTSQAQLSVTQSLLRGYGTDVNLAVLRQARVDTRISEYELRGFAESLVAQTEETYWDCVLAERRIGIFSQSLELARRQSAETHARVRVGDLAATELAAADAEVALRGEDLINARSALTKTRIALLRLISPSAHPFHTELVLEERPQPPDEPLGEEEEHVALGLKMRPDLNQARLQVERGDLSVVATRNGLLPKMDLFLNLSRTGYSDSFSESVSRAGTGSSYNLSAGVNLELPPINRAARAAHTGALLTRNQSSQAVGNLAQLVEADVRTACAEVLRAAEQVSATAASRKLQEEKLKSETAKFRVGQSTAFLVAQAQRDLLSSQIDEIDAAVTYRKALVEIYRLEGSLLRRRGIAAPGEAPVEDPRPVNR